MKRFTWPFRWLGVGLAILSIVQLVAYGFHIGWIAPFRLVVDYYEALLHALLGWSEPYLRGALEYMNKSIGWHLHLYPHWKSFFVLIWLYFGAEAKNSWWWVAHEFRGELKDGRILPYHEFRYDRWWRNVWLSTFTTLWGGLVALFSAIICGAVPIERVSGLTYPNLLFAIVPVAAFLLFRIGIAAYRNRRKFHGDVSKDASCVRRRFFSLETREPIFVATALFIIMAVSTKFISLPVVVAIPNPGLVLLLIVVLGISFGELLFERARGIVAGYFEPQGKSEGVWFFGGWDNGSQVPFGGATVPIQVLTAVAGATLFVASNAGLRLVGV